MSIPVRACYGTYRFVLRYDTYKVGPRRQRLTSPVLSDQGEIPLFESPAAATHAAQAHGLPLTYLWLLGYRVGDVEFSRQQDLPVVDYHAGMTFHAARQEVSHQKPLGARGTTVLRLTPELTAAVALLQDPQGGPHDHPDRRPTAAPSSGHRDGGS